MTKKDLLTFLAENGFKEGQGFQASDLKHILKGTAKVDFTKFVKLIID